MISGCHWRDLPYRTVKALRSRLHARFPAWREAAAAARFRAYPGADEGQARRRILATNGLLLLSQDTASALPVDSTARSRILEEALQIRCHCFDILGSGLVDYSTPIRWHWDPKSDYEWPADSPWQKARSLTPEGADLKVPWELSRCHQLVTLGVAWNLERNPLDWQEFISQIRCWINANPYPLGVNWACPMDVAIRLVNWLTALGLFHDALKNLEGTDELFQTIDRSIWEHGWHIARNLEASGPRCLRAGNHLYADLCGLLAAGLYFDESSTGRRWTATAIQGLEAQNQRQFLADGSPGESSTSYHRLLLEMALWSEAIIKKSGYALSEASSERIDLALTFARNACDPAGNSPNIGDNDSGRLLVVLRDNEANHAYLWQRDTAGAGGLHHGLLTGANRPLAATDFCGSYASGGFYILKSTRLHACIRAGHIGHGGVHSHCDQLSITLSVDGIPLLTDPGSYLYTSDPVARNRFRSGGCHNIALPADCDQNTLGTGRTGVFRMTTRHEARIVSYEADARGGRLRGIFEYPTTNGTATWTRTVEIKDSHCCVTDVIAAESVMPIHLHFHFSPAATVAVAPGGVSVQVGGRELHLSWRGDIQASVENTMHSFGYGKQEPCRVLRLRGDTAPGSPLEITFDLQLEK